MGTAAAIRSPASDPPVALADDLAALGPVHDFAPCNPWRHEPGTAGIALGRTRRYLLARMGADSAGALAALLTACVGIVMARYAGQSRAALVVAAGVGASRRLCFGWEAHTTLTQLRSHLLAELGGADKLFNDEAPAGAAASPLAWSVTLPPTHAEHGGPAELSCVFRWHKACFDAEVAYNALLYRPASISVLARQLCHVIASAIENPESRVAAFTLHDHLERHRILHSFNRTQAPFALNRTLPDLIAAQARRTPDAVCAVHRERKMTYRELDAAATRWAGLLWRLGVRPGRFVAIYEPRGLPFIVAVLATWKAGGAYVPVDPDYPPERVRHMLDDSEARVLVVGRCGMARFEALRLETVFCTDIVCLEGAVPALSGRPSRHVHGPQALPGEGRPGEWLRRAGPRDPAYMIYTSGSTGLPKGAIVRHDGAVNHILAQGHALGRPALKKFLQSAPCSSDISVWQFAAPLVFGGMTVILDSAADVDDLAEQMRQHEVSIIELVPSVLAALVEHLATLPAQRRSYPALCWAMVTGESVPVSLINAWLDLYPGIPVVNAYGPTEASDDVAQAIVRHPLPPRLLRTPIGQALANLDVHVLDDELEPAPIGVPGQICVAGVGVGAGYWNRADKTRASFRPNPFTDGKGEVLYLTGDIGRRLDDGTIECLGRTDGQVKLHGFRVELSEIEAVLHHHRDVAQAAVVVTGSEGGRPRLSAFVVGRDPAAADEAGLRAFLAAHVPRHMVPAQVVMLPCMPLNPAGKIDRAALARLPVPKAVRPTEAAALLSPAEAVIARIWCEEFGQAVIGLHERFFDLGGDSIIAMGIVSGARDAGLRLRMSDVFDHPTIAELAAVAQRPPCVAAVRLDAPPPMHGDGSSEQRAALLEAAPELEDAYPLSPTQHAIYLHSLLCADKSVYVDQYCGRLHGGLDRAAFCTGWQRAVARHPALRSAVVRLPRGGLVQVVHRHAVLPITWVDATGLDAPSAQALLSARREADLLAGLPLGSAPLMRLTVVQLDDATHYMVWTHHHLILDGWSMSRVLQEVLQALAGPAAPLQAEVRAPSQGDLVRWLLARDTAPDEQYWRQVLAGCQSAGLRAWHHRTTEPSRFEAADAALSAETTRAVVAGARRHGVTLSTLLSAAWALLLARRTGTGDLLFGMVCSGRDEGPAGIESIVGLAVVTLPLRLQVPDRPDGDWLRAVQAIATSARAHATLTPEDIRKRCTPWLRGPLFDSLVVVANYPGIDIGRASAVSYEAAEFRTVPAYPLTLLLTPGDALSIRLVHDRSRCDAPTARRTLDEYLQGLAWIAADGLACAPAAPSP